MQEVSVYTRPHGGSRTPQKANPNEIYPVGTTYQLRYGSKWLTLKKGCPILNLEEDCPSVAEAQICAIRLRTLLFTGATAAPQAQPRQKPKPEVQTVDKQIDNYLYGTEGKAAQKDWRKHTLQCYARSLKLFRESCKKVRDEEIDGERPAKAQGVPPPTEDFDWQKDQRPLRIQPLQQRDLFFERHRPQGTHPAGRVAEV